jgi:hypothetical protein
VSTNRFVRLIETLCLHEVRYIVVGGVAAVLQRVPVNTMDFDIVHDRDPENVQRLSAALALLGATVRDSPQNLSPTQDELATAPCLRLRTGHLDLDLMGILAEGLTYADLLPDSEKIEVAGYIVDVLKLEKLIDLKRKATRPKDRFMLIHLEATLEERERMRQ